MTSNLPSDDREARKAALEKIAQNRQLQLQKEREIRERKQSEEGQRGQRQQQEALRQEALEQANLEASHAFTLEQRHKRFEQEAERKKKLEEQKKLDEEARKKKEEADMKKEYMNELHDKSVRKKIEARKVIIADEEAESLKIIDNREHEDTRVIEAQLKAKLEHLERDAKQASFQAMQARDRSKVMAEDKRNLLLQQLKQESFTKEQEARRLKEPARTHALTAARAEASARKMQIERDYKTACHFADTTWDEGERERKLTLQKRLQEAHADAVKEQKHAAQTALEHRNEAHVRRVGEEQWLLGKDE